MCVLGAQKNSLIEMVLFSTLNICSVSARPEFLGVIDDPLFENLGVIGKLRGSELF